MKKMLELSIHLTELEQIIKLIKYKILKTKLMITKKILGAWLKTNVECEEKNAFFLNEMFCIIKK